MAVEKLTNQQKIVLLAANNSYDSIYLSDQNIFKLGTNRRSEVLKAIGNTGEPFEKRYRDYLESL